MAAQSSAQYPYDSLFEFNEKSKGFPEFLGLFAMLPIPYASFSLDIMS